VGVNGNQVLVSCAPRRQRVGDLIAFFIELRVGRAFCFVRNCQAFRSRLGLLACCGCEAGKTIPRKGVERDWARRLQFEELLERTE
jgi:hypothetical protein